MPIAFDPDSGTFLLRTPSTAYAVRLIDGVPRLVHWGGVLDPAEAAAVPLRDPGDADEAFGEELPTEGGPRFGPPGLRVEFADGTRAVQWRYTDHDVDTGHLRIGLADEHYPLAVDLHYRVFDDVDVIERWVTVRHTGAGAPIAVERVDSACWTLPYRSDYRLSHVAGEWSAEFQLQRGRLVRGETVLTSRRGATRHQVNPWVTLDPGDATEEHGEVWSAALAWSGSFRITARRTLGDHVAVTGGADQDGARWTLRPGERHDTPVFAGLYAAGGFGAASRQWHRYAREHVLPSPDELRPVLYNGWEGTGFDVNEANQMELAGIAATLGAELFVMDDGWFGGRVNEHAGLGDWWPNPERFPKGLTPLIEEVHRLGMRFGLWVEPEMVNPDSDLYRRRPDWVLHMANRTRTEQRSQLVLNMARADVAAWAYEWLDRLLRENAIDFLKWDMNRAFTEAGWPAGDDPGRLWVDYTRNVYDILDRLRAAHPVVRIESCASGGGRADHGVLRRTDQVWTSDNTDPVDRIAIQHGFGQVYPAIVMGAWASDSPNPVNGRETPLRFRFHVAMAGALGISGNLSEWSTSDRAEAARLIAAYKRIRPVVQHGQLYRLATGQTTVVEYVSEGASEVALLAWRPARRHGEPTGPLRLRGLDPGAAYVDGGGGEHRAAVLMNHGLELDLPAGDHASALVQLHRRY
ncbi:MAG TPA: alpha-galactosidase [Micromonosporaceae bacterium]